MILLDANYLIRMLVESTPEAELATVDFAFLPFWVGREMRETLLNVAVDLERTGLRFEERGQAFEPGG
ncbi:MAG: hypothetical protein ACLFPV_14550 [Spirochaetaceae bacterium]